MAENKKSFLLYCDLIHTVEKLPNEKAGELFKHILNYVNDNDPTTTDLIIEVSFEPIRQQLKRDLIKYSNIVDRNRNNGSKGGRPKKPKKPSGLIGNPSEPKKPDSDTDNDSVNVNDIKDKPTKVDSFDWVILLEFINKHTKRSFKTINKKIQQKFKARLKDGYTKGDIMNSIINASDNDYHKENGRQYLTPEFFSRADTLDKYGSEAKPQIKFNPNAQPAN